MAVDEAYVKLRGRWVYLYRVVDRAGRMVDFRLCARRDVAAAKTFFKKAIKSLADLRRPSRSMATRRRTARCAR
jgi:transposase-like protein